ncbi:hypothetical protein GCM10011506_12190 [Marivirga lumbricoides]|uniref:N-acetyltransferase domain-containing protein n=1 Tax=Marivirga lumbricoides TaxID=1046115 RepID=A0ABQ1LR56_9BACT|nr:hypothetical protein GCM10011506_12190 [Marivirga lumbricoides]
MNIRKATHSDIPQIIQLLKNSLGESLMPKSEAYWQWKHINNPFGASPVWVAEEEGQLIGVRAFMQWSWEKEGMVLNAIRAVDTATDPSHQGKGIFKKLTLGLLEQCEAEGIDLVFNTPNSQSKPGYLKMGWQEAGKLPIKISFKRPFHILKAKIKGGKETQFLKVKNANQFDLKTALDNYTFDFEPKNHWQTAYDLKYLHWRYAEIPIIPYYAHYNKEACCIFRLKAGALGIELRVCDTFGQQSAIEKLLQHVYKNCTFDYMSITGFSSICLPGLVKRKMNIGPDVTIRPLAKREVEEFQQFKNWHPALGDLEVF